MISGHGYSRVQRKVGSTQLRYCQFQLRRPMASIILPFIQTKSCSPWLGLHLSLIVSQSGGLIGSLRPSRANAEALQRGAFQHWISLPAIRVDSAYLQTLGDLRSDYRFIIRFSSSGDEEEVRVVDAPMGLQVSSLHPPAIYGTRDLGNILEFVRYRWRWSLDHDDSPSRR